MIAAIDHQDVDLVAALLNDGSRNPRHMLRFAVERGNAAIVALLLADARVRVDSHVLIYADDAVTRLLLADGRVNPRARDSGALQSAVYYNDVDKIRTLLNDGRVNPAAVDPLTANWPCLRVLLTDARAHRRLRRRGHADCVLRTHATSAWFCVL